MNGPAVQKHVDSKYTSNNEKENNSSYPGSSSLPASPARELLDETRLLGRFMVIRR